MIEKRLDKYLSEASDTKALAVKRFRQEFSGVLSDLNALGMDDQNFGPDGNWNERYGKKAVPLAIKLLGVAEKHMKKTPLAVHLILEAMGSELDEHYNGIRIIGPQQP